MTQGRRVFKRQGRPAGIRMPGGRVPGALYFPHESFRAEPAASHPEHALGLDSVPDPGAARAGARRHNARCRGAGRLLSAPGAVSGAESGPFDGRPPSTDGWGARSFRRPAAIPCRVLVLAGAACRRFPAAGGGSRTGTGRGGGSCAGSSGACRARGAACSRGAARLTGAAPAFLLNLAVIRPSVFIHSRFIRKACS